MNINIFKKSNLTPRSELGIKESESSLALLPIQMTAPVVAGYAVVSAGVYARESLILPLDTSSFCILQSVLTLQVHVER